MNPFEQMVQENSPHREIRITHTVRPWSESLFTMAIITWIVSHLLMILIAAHLEWTFFKLQQRIGPVEPLPITSR